MTEIDDWTFISFTLFKTRKCVAAHRHARMARLDHRAMKIIDPLTNPTAHGASASDAFHLVIPSNTGLTDTRKTDHHRWDGPHIARAWWC